MSTGQTIVNIGYAQSAAARPETLETPTELVSRLNSCVLEAFQVMTRENIYIIGTSVSMAFDGSGWPRPSNCLRAIKVLATGGTVATPAITSGTEVNVVPYDDQAMCAGEPSLTELGQSFVPTGQSIDPSGGTLTLVYARTPVAIATLADSIDALFPSMFDSFLQYDIAAYLAIKDKRAEDEQIFLTLKSGILQQLIDWCRQQTYGIVQRFPLVTPPLTNTNSGRAQPTKGGG